MPPFVPVAGNATLTIYLDFADADSSSEYLNIYGEDGVTFIGKTDTVPYMCGSNVKPFTVSAAKLNSWMADGDLILKLAPNGSGGSAINPTCQGGRVRATLSYPIAHQKVPIALTYTLDGGPPLAFPPAGSTFLDVGAHTIVYTATDCAGNSSTASTTIVIQDLQPPILEKPNDITAYVGPANCTATVVLPFPVITENCDMSGMLSQASALLPVQFQSDPDAGKIPKNITMSISGLIPNAVANGTLRIRYRGDNANPGEFFKIYDENLAYLSKTDYGPVAGECVNFHETGITVTATQINNWAGNGSASFTAVANNDVLGYTDFINPCGPLAPDKTDGISRIQAVLEYKYALVTFEVRKNGNQIASGSLTGNQTTITEGPGIYTVKYLTTDNSGLVGTTSFTITVLDTIRPKAKCKPISILVNPSGYDCDKYTLQPAQINDGSSDNCTGTLTYKVSQQLFTCNQATPPNNIYPVTLTVTDASGNSATCTTTVQVLIQPCMPTASPVCIGGTLHLAANPPPGCQGNPYASYSWSHPAGSPLINTTNPNLVISPVQPFHQGTYQVAVVGVTGCVSTGLVTVDPVSLPYKPDLHSNAQVCLGDSIHLWTDTYSGQNVVYKWYMVNQSQGTSVLLDSTSMPDYFIHQPPVGNYQFFVIVAADGCASVQSNSITVTVFARPVATISQPPLAVNKVCEGQPIVFSTTSQGTPQAPYSYQWTGPNFFSYSVQSPPVIQHAAPADGGIYTLVVTQNGCVSDPAKTTIIITPKPAQPLITGDSLACEGAAVHLTCNPTVAEQFKWTSGATVVNTASNVLTLPGVTVASTGNWQVQVTQNSCTSDPSSPFHIDVQAYPDVSSVANITLCDYDTLHLNATANAVLPSWSWTGPGFTTFTQNANRFPPVSGTYTVVGKTKNGCADSAFVNVSAVPRPFVTATNDAPICSDGITDAHLQLVVVSANNPFMYTWSGPGGFMSSDPMPTIPKISVSNNGSYTVVVKDKYGCKSNPATTTINTHPPLPQPPIQVSAGTVCQGDTVTFSVNYTYPNGTKFVWHTPGSPNGLPPTTQTALVIYGAQASNAGMYQVQVFTDTCASTISNPITLTVHPHPAVPIPIYVTPLCEGGTLQLGVKTPVNGGIYNWWSSMAAIPFTVSNNQTPSIPNVTQGNAGKYFVQVFVDGCASAVGEPVTVVVGPVPAKPAIQPPNPQRICRDQAGQLKLQLKPAVVLPSTTFVWVLQQNNDTLSVSSSTSFTTSDLSHLHPGANEFRVKAIVGQCESAWSDTVTVYLDTIPKPVIAYAGADRILCVSQSLKLDAAQVAGATGIWTQLTGPIVAFNSTDPKTSVSGSGLKAGNTYQFAWTLSNGGCKNFAADTVKITTVAPEKAKALDDTLKLCADTMVQIHALQGVVSKGKWTQFNQQLNILQPDSTTTLVTHLYPGNKYFFGWTLPDIGCGISQDTVVVINYPPKPYVGPDRNLCTSDGCTNLAATDLYPQLGETGVWSSIPPGLLFSNPTSNITTVCNLQLGDNLIVWTLDSAFCGSLSRDTLVVRYQRLPTAVEDDETVGYGALIDFNVLNNDVLPADFTIQTNTQPLHGALKNSGNGSYMYQPDAGFYGEDQFIYEVCNRLCPDTILGCSSAYVKFTVETPGKCQIPTIITPNNDGKNDAFVIPATCLGDGGGIVELTVFNQYGDLVYHARPYNNDWEGTYNGQPLPAGTYFFELKFNDSDKPKTGFLIIQQ
jgi:gliding motility-associated-like protein